MASMYFLAQNNQKTGPFTLDQLREMWRVGAVYPQTLYWEDGMAEWQQLSRLDASLLDLGLSTPAAFPVAPASPEPSAYDLPASYLPAGPVFAPPAPTAAQLPPPVAPPGAPHSLIAPTSLPGSTPGTPVGPLPTRAPEMPPAAYLSLIFAILGPGLGLIGHGIGVFPGIALSIAAVVAGHTARSAIRHSGNRLPGDGMAVSGLILGYGCLGLVLMCIVLAIVGFLFAIGIPYLHLH